MSQSSEKQVEELLSRGNLFTFDSERGAKQSDLCRRGKDGQVSCLKVPMTSEKLFQFMSKSGFFCSKALDPGNTAIECRRIAEKPLEEL